MSYLLAKAKFCTSLIPANTGKLTHYFALDLKQLLDEVEHDIMNYQNRGLCYLLKPKAEADNTDTFSHGEAFSHFVSEENTPRGLVTRQTLNLT